MQNSDRGPVAWWLAWRRRWRQRHDGATLAPLPAEDSLLLEWLRREASRAQRHGHDGVLLLLELDPWLRLYQQHGDAFTRPLNQRLGQMIQQHLRAGDWVLALPAGHWALYLPCTDPLGALDAAERMRTRVGTLDYRWEGQPVALSATVGVAHWQDWKREPQQAAEPLLQQARQALALARSAGCNCVRTFAPLPSGRNRYSGTRPA